MELRSRKENPRRQGIVRRTRKNRPFAASPRTGERWTGIPRKHPERTPVITLGIDCGTQSLKTVALDGDSGKVIASASKAYGLVEGLPAGHLEQDPAIWWDALEETVQKVLHLL